MLKELRVLKELKVFSELKVLDLMELKELRELQDLGLKVPLVLVDQLLELQLMELISHYLLKELEYKILTFEQPLQHLVSTQIRVPYQLVAQ